MRAKNIVLVFCLIALLSQKLQASCCSQAASGGIGSLLPHERAYVEFINNSHWVTGSFDQGGTFKGGSPAHLPHWLINQELNVMARVADFFLPFVKLPARTSISKILVQTQLNDLTLGARFPLTKEGFIPMGPGISLLASARLQPAALKSSLLSLAIALEKMFGPVGLMVSYAIGAEANYFKNRGFSNGMMHAASLGANFSLSDNTKMSFTLSPTFYTPVRVNAVALPYTAKHQIALSTGFSWVFHSHLTLNTALGAHLPLALLGKNTNTEVFLQAGLRVGVF